MKKLLVFLGNPGSMYKGTRHNIGWQICDAFQISGWQKKFHGTYAMDGDWILLKPETFMNESGISVREAMDYFKVKPEDILVFHDDSELDFGQILLEKGGGLRGHKGLKSIHQHIGSRDFQRLRFGIGRPSRQDMASYVLCGFSEEENPQLGDLVAAAAMMARKAMQGQ